MVGLRVLASALAEHLRRDQGEDAVKEEGWVMGTEGDGYTVTMSDGSEYRFVKTQAVGR